MKSFKNHLSFLLPLFILLFSIQFSVMVKRGVQQYEHKLLNDYQIMIVTKRFDITLDELKKINDAIISIEPIDTNKYIKQLANENITNEELAKLKKELPHFFSIKINKVLSFDELNKLKADLFKIKGVLEVEIYKKTYEKLHQFLLLIKLASYTFTVFIFIISILLIVKQMEIWTYEHKNRMYVMSLFGAPYSLKSAPLYKLVIIDSIISTFLVSFIYLNLPNFVDLDSIYNQIGIEFRNFHFFSDTLFLLFVSTFISVVAVTIIILRQESKGLNT